jgi:uncharacterized membrane protein YgcG
MKDCLQKLKINKKAILVFFVVTWLFIYIVNQITPQIAYADTFTPSINFDVSSYHISIQIDEENNYTITEKILIDYDVYRQGVILSVADTITLYLDDLEGDGYVAKSYYTDVADLDVKTYSGDLIALDTDGVITGGMLTEYSGKIEYLTNYVDIYTTDGAILNSSTSYVHEVSYTMEFGFDKLDSYDFFYYNLVSTDLVEDIDHVSFDVTLPSNFDYTFNNDSDESTIKFFSQTDVSVANMFANEDINNFAIVDNKISGVFDGMLGAGDGLTIRVVLPNDYFNTQYDPSTDYILLGFFILLLLGGLATFYSVKGRKQTVIPVVNFYPPDNMTPAKMGYLYDGRVDSKDITSLIIYWAQKGYLKIKEDKNEKITLIKIKDLPSGVGVRSYEKTVFNGIFKSKDEVKMSSLKNKFYKTMAEAKKQVKTDLPYDVFDKKTTKAKNTLQALAVLVFAFTIFKLAIASVFPILFGIFPLDLPIIAVILLGAGLSFFLVYNLIQVFSDEKNYDAKKYKIFIFTSIFLGALYVFIIIFWFGDIYNDMFYLKYISIFLGLFLSYLAAKSRSRTKRSAEHAGNIMGFKNYLMTAEKDRIEMLVKEDPEYFYNVLAYTYVLDVTDAFAKKFEAIALEDPDWYVSTSFNNHTFSIVVLSNRMQSSLNSMSNSLSSAPSNSGSGGGYGGGGGGGGFSGGGAGGSGMR